MPPKQDKEKKDDKKPAAPSFASKNPAAEIIGLLVVLMLGTALVNRIYAFLTGDLTSSEIFDDLKDFYDGYKVFAGIAIAALALFLFNTSRKIGAIRAEERKELYPETEETPQQAVNRKWQRVVDHLESPNPSDWRLSILEADIILDEMLDSMGYHGESIGEKLKQVERSDFLSIDQAWEAHKVRNMIAHQGSDYVVTQKEAFRVITLYKKVFEEFFFI